MDEQNAKNTRVRTRLQFAADTCDAAGRAASLSETTTRNFGPRFPLW